MVKIGIGHRVVNACKNQQRGKVGNRECERPHGCASSFRGLFLIHTLPLLIPNFGSHFFIEIWPGLLSLLGGKCRNSMKRLHDFLFSCFQFREVIDKGHYHQHRAQSWLPRVIRPHRLSGDCELSFTATVGFCRGPMYRTDDWQVRAKRGFTL